jgi:site-specific recombinase XerC
MFVMVEQATGAFTLRCVSNDTVIDDLRKQGALDARSTFRRNGQSTVARQFQDARKVAGLPNDLVLYCARHGFGTEMYRATKNLFAVMKAMGRAAVATTMKYQHQDIDEIAHVASQRVQ